MTLSAMVRAAAEAYHSGFWRRMAVPQRTCVSAPVNSAAISMTPSVAPKRNRAVDRYMP